MKILFLWLMPILLIIGSTNEANARSKKKKEKQKPNNRLTVFKRKKECLRQAFKDKKKHTINKGTITVHQYEDKIYLELPVELMGRDF